MNMFNFVRIATLIIIIVAFAYLYRDVTSIERTDPGRMYAAVVCKEDSRGVVHCRDTKSGRSWTITPSPVGTGIA